MSRYKMDDDERYEQGYYDDYQEEEEVGEEEEEEEEEVPTKEEQDFLKLREELKEKFRKQLKLQASSGSKAQVKKGTIKNDSFGSFFGPSKPVIASRVLDESRSIRETQHILSKNAKSLSNHVKDYSSSDKKTTVSKPQPVVNEAKRKAQTLKDMRDYSFLLSDDADIPDAKEEPKQPVRKPSIHDARSSQEQIRSKQQSSKPTRPIPNGTVLKNPASRNPQSQTRMAPAKGTPLNKPRPITASKRPNEPRNGSSRPLVQRVIQSKPSSQPMVSNRPPANSSKMIPTKNKPAPVVSHSSAQKNRMPEQQPKRPTQSVNNRPMVSSKSQPPKNIPPQHRREERVVSKQPVKRRLNDDDDEGEAAISMIRQMFKYNPRKYADDDDDSDMEADFHEIEREERRSAKIAQMEDEEQARLIEEEERRERMRKKQKLKRG